MALPTILFNNATGSDTAASGAGPGTALTGAGASLNSTTAVDLSADSPDLSGVATDGSAVLWVKTSSGQQYAKITNTNNGTKVVTVATAYGVTESGKTWGIGGKRKTLDHADSRILLTTATGALPGWTLSLEDAQTISSVITGATSGDTTNGPIIIKGATEGIVLTQSTNANHFASTGASNPTRWRFVNLKFANSFGTKTSAIGLNMNTGQFECQRCIFGDATNSLLSGMARAAGAPTYQIEDCEVTRCTGTGIAVGGNGHIFAKGCWIHDCGSIGIQGNNNYVIENCLITGNADDGINVNSAGNPVIFVIENNTIHGNGGDGLDMSIGVLDVVTLLTIKNNHFTSNGNFGIRAASGQSVNQMGIDYNNYGTGATANTSGSLSNLNAGANDLAVDPQYTATGSNNYGVGANVQDKAFPLSTRNMGANQSATVNASAVGAAEPQVTGGGNTIAWFAAVRT